MYLNPPSTRAYSSTPLLRPSLTFRACLLATIIFLSGCVEAPTGLRFSEIEAPARAPSGEPNLTVSPDGIIYMSWIEVHAADTGDVETPETHVLLFSFLDEKSGWSDPRRIASGTDWFVNWADIPALAVGTDGHMMASWLQKNGEDTYAYGVRLSQSTDGGLTWSPPITPHDTSQTEHGFVSLIAADDHSFQAVWLDGRETAKKGPMTLRTARISASGELSNERLLDDRICDCCPTSAVRGPDGSFLAAYRNRTEDEIRDIHMARWSAGEAANNDDITNDGWQISGCPVSGPVLAPQGETLGLTWFTMGRESTPAIFVQFSTDRGKTFRSAVQMDRGSPVGRVDMAWIDDSTALVCWMELDGDSSSLWIQTVSTDAPPGESLEISRFSSGRSSGYPQLASANRQTIIAWTDPAPPRRIRTGLIRR